VKQMDDQVVLTRDPNRQTTLAIRDNDGNLTMLGGAYFHLLRHPGEPFPSYVWLLVDRIDKLDKDESGFPLPTEGRLEVGMTGELTAPARIGYPTETLFFEIIRVEDEGQKVLLQVEKPVNVPIEYDSFRSLSNRAFGGNFSIANAATPRWAVLETLVGLILPCDVELDANMAGEVDARGSTGATLSTGQRNSRSSPCYVFLRQCPGFPNATI
jgi:hypothetical protein